MSTPAYQPVFEATRGPIVESIHYGAFAVVDSRGQLLASHGDAEMVTYLRSSSKPFQALPFIEKGGADHFGLDEREVAILCASHSGTDEHVAVVRGMQAKMSIPEGALQCGSHTPGDSETAYQLRSRGEQPLPVRHMCSGKHSGMLGMARMSNLPLETYLSMDHPVQQAILQSLGEMASISPAEIVIGTDGCSAPNFALPLKAAALAMARLCQPDGLAPARAAACCRLADAMRHEPGMIAGPGKFDTLLMQAAPRVVAKGGAEGYQILGVMKDAIEPGSPALGIAMKISDGDAGDSRARQLVSVEILRQLGALSTAEAAALSKFGPRRIYNFARLDVGEYRAAFSIGK